MIAPGPAVIIANSQRWTDLDIAPSQQIICSLDALAVATPPPDRLLGILATTADIVTPIAKAVELGTRIFCLFDSPDFYPLDVLKKLRPWDCPLLETYLVGQEAIEDAENRWAGQCTYMDHHWPHLWGTVWMDYTQNGTQAVQRVLNAQPSISRLVSLFPRLAIVAPFAWQRADGCTANPPLAEVVTRIAAASLGAATFIPVGVPPVQKRTIYIRLRDGLFAQTNFAGDRSVTSGPQNPESVWTPTVLSASGLWDVGSTVILDCAGLPFNPWDVYPDAINIPSPIKTPIRTATLWQIGRGEAGIGWSLQTEATLGMVYRPDLPTRPLTLDDQATRPASVWSFDCIDAVTGEVLQNPF